MARKGKYSIKKSDHESSNRHSEPIRVVSMTLVKLRRFPLRVKPLSAVFPKNGFFAGWPGTPQQWGMSRHTHAIECRQRVFSEFPSPGREACRADCQVAFGASDVGN